MTPVCGTNPQHTPAAARLSDKGVRLLRPSLFSTLKYRDGLFQELAKKLLADVAAGDVQQGVHKVRPEKRMGGGRASRAACCQPRAASLKGRLPISSQSVQARCRGRAAARLATPLAAAFQAVPSGPPLRPSPHTCLSTARLPRPSRLGRAGLSAGGSCPGAR